MPRTNHIDERQLTPEEDSIGDPDDQDVEIDDLMPADLWFHSAMTIRQGAIRS